MSDDVISLDEYRAKADEDGFIRKRGIFVIIEEGTIHGEHTAKCTLVGDYANWERELHFSEALGPGTIEVHLRAKR